MIHITRKTLMLVALSLVLAFAAPSAFAQDGRYYCHIKRTEGDVLIQRANEFGIDEAYRTMPVMAGDRLWTEISGRAIVQFYDGSTISMDSNTKLDFESIGESVEGYQESTLVKLWSGSVYLNNYHDNGNEANLQIETLVGYVSILNRGEYRIDVDEDFTLRVTVYEGMAEMGNDEGVVMIRSGQRLFLDPGDVPGGVVGISGYDSDNFNVWVNENIHRRNEVESARYVDDSLDYLVDDMDDYGEWQYYDDYETHVWVPNRHYIHDDWRPYDHGHWVWTPHGWMFVSYDPWSWVTYRYGRWDYGHHGWCWIPGYRWSPSWVYWEIGHNYIGWAPLGYYNYPVSRYWYKKYPRGYRPRHGDGHARVDGKHLTIVAKNNFGKTSIRKYALKDAQLKNLNRKNAKVISASVTGKGFADRKANYKASVKSIKNASFKDLPNGIYRKSTSKTYSTKKTYGTRKSTAGTKSGVKYSTKSKGYNKYSTKPGTSGKTYKYSTSSKSSDKYKSSKKYSTSSGKSNSGKKYSTKTKKNNSSSSRSKSSKSYRSKSSSSSSSKSSSGSKSYKKKDNNRAYNTYGSNNKAYRTKRYASSSSYGYSGKSKTSSRSNKYYNPYRSKKSNKYSTSRKRSSGYDTKRYGTKKYSSSSKYRSKSYSKPSYGSKSSSKYRSKSYYSPKSSKSSSPYSSYKSSSRSGSSRKSYGSSYKSSSRKSYGSSYKSSSRKSSGSSKSYRSKSYSSSSKSYSSRSSSSRSSSRSSSSSSSSKSKRK